MHLFLIPIAITVKISDAWYAIVTKYCDIPKFTHESSMLFDIKILFNFSDIQDVEITCFGLHVVQIYATVLYTKYIYTHSWVLFLPTPWKNRQASTSYLPSVWIVDLVESWLLLAVSRIHFIETDPALSKTSQKS